MARSSRDYIPQAVRRIFEGDGNPAGDPQMTRPELEKRLRVYRKALSLIEDHLDWYWSEDGDKNKAELDKIIEEAIEALMRIKS